MGTLKMKINMKLKICLLNSLLLAIVATGVCQAQENAASVRPFERLENVRLHDARLGGATEYGPNLTFNLRTDLVWLASDVVQGLSKDEVESRIKSPDDVLSGFRFATESEISTYLSSLGVPVPGEKAESDNAGDAYFLVKQKKFIRNHDPQVKSKHEIENNLTFDARTGLNWLNVSATLNQSINDIRARLLDPKDELHAYRYPTQEEIGGLLEHYELPASVGEVEGKTPASALMNDLCSQQDRNQFGPCFVAMWPASETVGQNKQIYVHLEKETSHVSQSGMDVDKAFGFIGNFLVRK